ncbi:hypothetical protein EAO69_05435 [Streptomyces sp. me109]|uniref:hypothetical protein n=1 Tax=Streptomyces sp. me109 TaxID=1827853 RepID=UPI0011CEC753|nr:hypothetical protein [Streptomyces sp. me109]TXS79489.1 hypothetical protein EAO69_05435 [Streptomyces sp. me109]
MIRAYDQFAALLAKFRTALKTGQDLVALNAQLDDAYIDLPLAADGVHLLGPEEVWDAARQLAARSRETLVVHRDIAEVLRTRNDHSLGIPWLDLQPARNASGDALAEFSTACRSVLEGER